MDHIGFVRVAGQDHHVGDFADLQTASLLFIEGHPAGVVGTHFQCLLDGHRLGTIVAGFVNPDDGIGIGTGAVGAEGLDNTVIGIGLEGVQLCGTVAQNGLQVFVRLVGPVDEGTLDRQGDAVFGTDADTLLGGQAGVDDRPERRTYYRARSCKSRPDLREKCMTDCLDSAARRLVFM